MIISYNMMWAILLNLLEAGYKLTTNLYTRTKKKVGETSLPCINYKKLTIIHI